MARTRILPILLWGFSYLQVSECQSSSPFGPNFPFGPSSSSPNNNGGGSSGSGLGSFGNFGNFGNFGSFGSNPSPAAGSSGGSPNSLSGSTGVLQSGSGQNTNIGGHSSFSAGTQQGSSGDSSTRPDGTTVENNRVQPIRFTFGGNAFGSPSSGSGTSTFPQFFGSLNFGGNSLFPSNTGGSSPDRDNSNRNRNIAPPADESRAPSNNNNGNSAAPFGGFAPFGSSGGSPSNGGFGNFGSGGLFTNGGSLFGNSPGGFGTFVSPPRVPSLPNNLSASVSAAIAASTTTETPATRSRTRSTGTGTRTGSPRTRSTSGRFSARNSTTTTTRQSRFNSEDSD